MRYLPTKILCLFFLVFNLTTVQAQYTETINSNRPGASQGAFSVGKRVYQFEGGAYFGNEYHALRKSDTDIWGTDYSLRVGLLFEALEINLTGAFQAETITIPIGGQDTEFKRSNFRSNTLGAKYMIFDPFVSIEPDKPNLYSWKANQRFKWKTLIPAVAVYGGLNFSFGDNPYLYPEESAFSPKFALITQHNWAGSWVLVTNIIADKISDNNPTFAGIFTLTHAFTPKFAGFLEYQAILSNIYADDLARTGVALLIGDHLQFDVSGLINFKNTPDRWQVAAGFSYRIDRHEDDEFLEESEDGDYRRLRSKKLEEEQPVENEQ